MIRVILHLTTIILLTLIAQLGVLAWLIALTTRNRIAAFVAAYIALSFSAAWVAPLSGRVPLPCIAGGSLQMQSSLYCALNRHYVTPELAQVLNDHATTMRRQFPGTTTLVLDANFPFLTGYPLLPHLSHNDGRKADIAFHYQDATGYLDRTTRPPIGYFAFEDGPTDCPDRKRSMRWNMAWLQSLWPTYTLEPNRMQTALRNLAADPRVGKIFIEPHLKQHFAPDEVKIRFQGCRAARHDDHIHLQL